MSRPGLRPCGRCRRHVRDEGVCPFCSEADPRRAARWGLVVATGLVLQASPVSAQPAAEGAACATDDLECSIAELKRLHAASAEPQFLLRLALAYEKLGKKGPALTCYLRYAAACMGSTCLDVGPRTADLKPFTGSLRIAPEGRPVSIAIDGDTWDARHYDEPVQLEAGPRVIVVTWEGGGTSRYDYAIEAGRDGVLAVRDPRMPESRPEPVYGIAPPPGAGCACDGDSAKSAGAAGPALLALAAVCVTPRRRKRRR